MARNLTMSSQKINFDKILKMNNYKTLLLTAAISASSIGVAQKAKVVSAYNYNKSYEQNKDCEDLIKGLQAIEPATKDPKTSTFAKTWYYGGNLYFNSMISEDKACKEGYGDAMEKTYEYYMKALKLNIKEPSVADLDLDNEMDLQKFVQTLHGQDTKHGDLTYKFGILQQKFPYLANAFINAGVEAFQTKDFETAKKYSEKSVLVNGIIGRFDSLGIYNAALASENLEQYDEALTMYSILAQVGYGGPDIFFYMANVLGKKGEDDKRIEVLNAGLEKYPDNSDLMVEKLSYLLKEGKDDEAMAYFEKAISAMPDNPSLYYNRGYTLEKMGKFEEAAKDYSKALEVDPTFFDAAYNLGAMYYNQGVEWNNKASKYGLDEQSKYDTALKNANDNFEKAMPALEKAHELNDKDQATIASLVSIYSRLGEEAKYNTMKAKIEGQ